MLRPPVICLSWPCSFCCHPSISTLTPPGSYSRTPECQVEGMEPDLPANPSSGTTSLCSLVSEPSVQWTMKHSVYKPDPSNAAPNEGSSRVPLSCPSPQRRGPQGLSKVPQNSMEFSLITTPLGRKGAQRPPLASICSFIHPENSSQTPTVYKEPGMQE